MFGRPPHIHSRYSDVERLSLEDVSVYESAGPGTHDEAKTFLVDMCKLALMLNKCLLTKFSATVTVQAVSEVYADLVECSDRFACRVLQRNGTLTIACGFYPAVLQLIHLDYLIVMQRMLSPSVPLSDSADIDASVKYAGMISRILEDFLSSAPDLVTRLPFLTFPAIFCSILINVISIRRQAGNIGILAEHRANLAMVILDQLQDRWPLVVWTRYLLQVLLKDTKRAPPTTAASKTAREQERPEQLTSYGSPSRTDENMQTPILGGTTQQQQRHSARNGMGFRIDSQDQSRSTIIDTGRFDSVVEADLSFSPMPFLFPLNSFLEDAGMEFWDLEQSFGESGT